METNISTDDSSITRMQKFYTKNTNEPIITIDAKRTFSNSHINKEEFTNVNRYRSNQAKITETYKTGP